MTITRDMEKLFLHTEHRVISAFQVTKWTAGASDRNKGRGTIRLPQPTGKLRVLCITVQRRERKSGLKASIHICKDASDHYQQIKSFRLKLLKRLSVIRDPSLGSHVVFSFSLLHRGLTGGEMTFAFEASNEETMMEILGILYSFCKSHDHRIPEIHGFSKADLGIYGELDDEGDEAEQSAQAESAPVGRGSSSLLTRKSYEGSEIVVTASEVPTEMASLEQRSSKRAALRTPMRLFSRRRKRTPEQEPLDKPVSENHRGSTEAKNQGSPEITLHSGPESVLGEDTIQETKIKDDHVKANEAQLSLLLDAVSNGGNSVEEYRTRITEELSALQEASVHEVLESSRAMERVRLELVSTLDFVDDLEESLSMLSTKLKLVQENMSVVEEMNNVLERTTNENRQVVQTLEDVLDCLTLSPETQSALRNPTLGSHQLDAIVSAAWDLWRHIQFIRDEIDGSGSVPSFPLASRESRFGGGDAARVDKSGKDVSVEVGDRRPSHRSIPADMKNMLAVQELQKGMLELSENFVESATRFLRTEIQCLADQELVTFGSLSAQEKLERPDHRRMHAKATRLASLTDVVVALMPQHGPLFRSQYCGVVNGLLRKEVAAMCKELRRQATESSTDPEMDLVTKKSDSIRTLERIHSMQATPRADVRQLSSLKRLQKSVSSIDRSIAIKLSSMSSDEAFECLASRFFPVLFDEAEMASKLFERHADVLSADDKEEMVVWMRDLFHGIEKQVEEFVDALCKSSKAISSLHMLGTCLYWIGKAKLSTTGRACSILPMLQRWGDSIKVIWDNFIQSKIEAIRKFDGKSSMSGAIRNVHVIPFVVNMEAFLSKMDYMVSEWKRKDGFSSPRMMISESTQGSRDAEGSAAGDAQRPSNIGQVLAPRGNDNKSGSELQPSPFASRFHDSLQGTDASASLSMTESPNQHVFEESRGHEPIAPFTSPGASLKAIAEACYEQLLSSTIDSIENHAAVDSKHSPRLRIENYAFLRLSLQKLPSGDSPVLQKYKRKVAEKRNAAVSEYVKQQIKNMKLESLFAMKNALLPGRDTEPTAKKAHDDGESSASNLAYQHSSQHVECPTASMEELVDALAAVSQGLEKRILSVRQRILKHFASSSPYLIEVVWDQVQRECVQNWDAAMQLFHHKPEMLSPVIPSSTDFVSFFTLAKTEAPSVEGVSPTSM